MQNNEQQKQRGRGRPQGSTSFTNVTLAELVAKFSDQQEIPVSRVFLEKTRAQNTQGK